MRRGMSHMPIRPVEFHILLDARRGGAPRLRDRCRRPPPDRRRAASSSPGTLYRALHRMLKDGWVAESAAGPAADLDDERRRYYRLTPARAGASASAEAARLSRGSVTVARAPQVAEPVSDIAQGAAPHWRGGWCGRIRRAFAHATSALELRATRSTDRDATRARRAGRVARRRLAAGARSTRFAERARRMWMRAALDAVTDVRLRRTTPSHDRRTNR